MIFRIGTFLTSSRGTGEGSSIPTNAILTRSGATIVDRAGSTIVSR